MDKCTKNNLNEMKKGKSMSDYMIGERARRRERRYDWWGGCVRRAKVVYDRSRLAQRKGREGRRKWMSQWK